MPHFLPNYARQLLGQEDVFLHWGLHLNPSKGTPWQVNTQPQFCEQATKGLWHLHRIPNYPFLMQFVS